MTPKDRAIYWASAVLFVLLVAFMFGFFYGDRVFSQELHCRTVHVDHDEHGPLVAGTEWSGSPETEGEVRYAIVGHYVWFQWGHAEDPDGGLTDTLSFDVSDPTVERVVGCTDGSVEIVHTQPTTTTTAGEVPVEASSMTVVSLEAFCDTHAGTLERYCVLLSKIMVVR